MIGGPSGLIYKYGGGGERQLRRTCASVSSAGVSVMVVGY